MNTGVAYADKYLWAVFTAVKQLLFHILPLFQVGVVFTFGF